MSQPILPLRTHLVVFAALIGLLILTVGAAYIDLGRGNDAVALGIAAIKAVLIALFFMHVRYSHKLTWAFSAAALLWLVILLGLTVSDYATRGWLGIDGK